MTSSIQPVEVTPLFPQRAQKQLVYAFWGMSIALLLYELYVPTASFLLNLGAILITIAALTSAYLWCSNRAQGLPIFPLFALPHLWAYALPLVETYPKINEYSIESRWIASLTVTGYLALSTWIWFRFVHAAPPAPVYYRALTSQKGNQFFLFSLGASVLFNVANTGGWIQLDGGSFAILRNTIVALTALAAFILAYRLGVQELTRVQAGWFIALTGLFMVTSAISFLLVGASTVFLSGVVAYVIGRRKIPILIIIVVAIVISFLHLGKSDMRSKYWFGTDQAIYTQPWEYGAIYAEWANNSLNYMRQSQAPESEKTEDRESIFERAGVIHMLMFAQTQSPTPIPFMMGRTYSILPELIVPRILNSNKIRSHEGTFMLNIHYGRQTYEDTFVTTIGWGLLPESYANFGLFGCAGLAVAIGIIYGKMTYWAINAPILSMRSMFNVFMFTFALQTEWTAGVYVAAIAQYGMVLLVIAIVLMENCSVPRSHYIFPTK